MATHRPTLIVLFAMSLLVTAIGLTSLAARPDEALHTTAHPSSTSPTEQVRTLLGPGVEAVPLELVTTTSTTQAPTTTTTTQPTPPPTDPPPAPPATGGSDAVWAHLATIKQCESRGNYGAVSGTGKYRGAYQFSRATWDSTARRSGRSDLVGVDPAAASPGDQDAMAYALYTSSGPGQWPHCQHA